ncbi:MAG: efflux RND transporter periplasmic adaptor subunit [Leptolyngbyaceae cyanobacterium MO_188.B28]|nr:efflux RND transporter periplasmic adaptor subunit [Leptolyngbyaceae cyanobacterium MO_188.B28]
MTQKRDEKNEISQPDTQAASLPESNGVVSPKALLSPRRLMLTLTGALFVAIGAVGFRGLGNSSSVATEEAPAAVTSPAQSVTIIEVQQQPVQRTLAATGTVVAHDMLPVLPKVSGLQIEQVLVDEGDVVTAGQVIAVLDSAVLKAQLQQAKAQLQSAEAVVQQRQAALAQAQANFAEAETNLARFQELANQGAVSQQVFDSRETTVKTELESVRVAKANIVGAEAEVQSQQARIQQLETELQQTSVKAPDSGLVAERFARVGNVTSSIDALFSVIRDRRLELEVYLPETQLPQVAIGASVQITSDSDPKLKFQGRVREIDPLIDPNTRQARLEIDLPTSNKLRPGMFLRANLILSEAPGIAAPAQAILPQPDGGSLVYRLVEGELVVAQSVEVGQMLNGTDAETSQVEILQGLRAGDQIVVAGAGYLKDGDRVNVTNLPPDN